MHLNAFSFFGRFTNTILYDNMKQIVTDRKIKASESRFNQKFMDFSAMEEKIASLFLHIEGDRKAVIIDVTVLFLTVLDNSRKEL